MLPVLILMICLLPGFAGSAFAQTTGETAPAQTAPVSVAEFEAYATGHTILYHSAGMEFGTEQYLPGRQVLWTSTEGICQRGSWFARGSDICFEYSDGKGPHCWAFHRDATGLLTAVYTSDSDGPVLTEASRSTTPLDCKGPFLGV